MTWNWNNVITTPHRWMAAYLKRRGWVVFYLDPAARRCRTAQAFNREFCWLELYLAGEQVREKSKENADRPSCGDAA